MGSLVAASHEKLGKDWLEPWFLRPLLKSGPREEQTRE